VNPDEIKALRLKMKLSQEAFAGELETTMSTVNRWERGHAKPTKRFITLMRQMREELDAHGN
jgi:putative transcriptional regulator